MTSSIIGGYNTNPLSHLKYMKRLIIIVINNVYYQRRSSMQYMIDPRNYSRFITILINNARVFSCPSVRRAIAIIDDKDRNRWDWRVSLKASGPPRPAGQVSRCQLMSPLPGTQDSRTLCGTVSKESPAEEQKEKFLRLLWFCRAIPGRQP